MISDLKAVIKYSLENFEFNGDIILTGHSRGFYISSFVARDSRIKGLISWMGRVSNLKDFISEILFEELERKGFLLHEDFIVTKKYIKDALCYDSSKVIKKLKIPVLLIYGENDNIVPPSEGIKFKKMCKGKDLTLKIIQGLNHYFYGDKIKKRVLKLTYNWIKKRFLIP